MNVTNRIPKRLKSQICDIQETKITQIEFDRPKLHNYDTQMTKIVQLKPNK